MNTDQDTTMPPGEPSSNVPAPEPKPSAAAEQTAQPGPSEGDAPEQEKAPQPPSAQPSPAAAKPPMMVEDEWEEQPGDDIGNRLPGRPPDNIGNRLRQAPRLAGSGAANRRDEGQAADAAQAPAAGKKRKRKRKRKDPAGEHAHEATEGAPAPAADDESELGEEEDDTAGNETPSDDAAEARTESPEGRERGGSRKKRPHGSGPGLRERPAFHIGEDVFGKVSKVAQHAVWIDISGKAMGLFDRRELSEGDPPVEGDQFIATVASTGVRGGMLMLSRTVPSLDEVRARIEAASQSGEPVEGFVTGAVKGGLEVDLSGLRAFAPASHVDLRHGADLNYLVGERLDFIVAQYAKKGRDIVVSRKKMLEEEGRRARAEALEKIEPGSVHKGIVRKVVQWGVFVALPDAGGVEGLIHMSEASHDRGAKLNDLFKPGAELEVKVLRTDDKGKLWLSRKAVTADPWDAVKEKYAVGTRHRGKVARLQPFGAFIELEPGIDGLCHTADLSLKPIDHPSEVVKVDDEIDVVVASCDGNAHKIGLHPAPPPGEEDEPRQRVQQYKAVKIAVAQVVEGGLVVRILGVTGRAARAFIPAGHTATSRGTDLRKEFPVGTRLEAKVLEVDPRRGEAKLSIRALKEDAEKLAYQQYRSGVAREAKFGTFADLMKKS